MCNQSFLFIDNTKIIFGGFLDKSAVLVLEDGTYFYGCSIGTKGVVVGEAVFNTSITGYQEILTDPSYLNQVITFTYPHIGNTGINLVDKESSKIYVNGIIIRDLSKVYSNFRATGSLINYLKRNEVIGISDIDTRKLTRLLRENGSQYCCIVTDPDLNCWNFALRKIKEFKKKMI